MANEAYNLSARGVQIVIEPEAGSEIVLTDFADDTDPLSIDDIEIGVPMFDINGFLFRKTKLESVSCHIALIPGSESEVKLKEFMLRNLPLSKGLSMIKNMIVHYSSEADENKHDFAFYTGFIIGSSIGYAATSQGRIKTKEYSFSFKSCELIVGANLVQ